MKSKSYAVLAVCILSLMLLLSACGGGSSIPAPEGNPQSSDAPETTQPAEERTLKDGLGNDVKIPAHPQRIIASYLEDHLLALGVKPVAQWSISDGKSVQNYLQDKLKDIPTIPHDLPYEAVMSFSPDLIILDSASMAEGDKYAQYSKIAPTYTAGSEQNNDWRQELLTIGEVLNKSAEAKKVLEDYDLKVKKAKEQLSPVVGDKPVAVLWVTAKSVFAPNEKLSSGDVLYRDLGFTVPELIKEVSKTSTANWNAVSLEKLAEMNVDYLFIVNTSGTSKDELVKDPVWAGIPAIKNGQLFEYDNTASWLYTGAIANSQMIDNILGSIVKK